MEEKQKIAEYYLSGLRGEFASDRMVAALKNIPPARATCHLALHRLYRKMRSAVGRAFQKNERSASTPDDAQAKVRQQVFPGIDLQEMQGAIERFHRLTGRFSSVRVAQMQEDVFCLYATHD